MDDNQRLAQLEARARMLEAELTGLNATIATLRARLSTSYAQPQPAAPVFAPVGIPAVPMPQQASAPAPAPAAIPSVPMPAEWQAAQQKPAEAEVPQEAPVEEEPLPVAWPEAPAEPVEAELPQAEPAEAAPAEGMYLPPMPPYDSLRHKWDIGTGEAPAEAAPAAYYEEQPAEAQAPVYAAEPEMRLFGLLSDGSPWEYRIPFSCMATEEGIYIGRDAEYAQVILDDASVSRCHLRLELTEQGVVVTDLNSTNGSIINDHVITEYENRLPLNDGDTLTLGNVTLQAQFLR